MSEHELWNELGNLYYLSGAYTQAAHAFNKAIQLEQTYGEAYSNLALVYAEQAKYKEAVQLYTQSLELLTNDEEKALAWNRLGNAYRQLQNYQSAVVAYQHADGFQINLDERQDRPSSTATNMATLEIPNEDTSVDADVDVGEASQDYNQSEDLPIEAECKREEPPFEVEVNPIEESTQEFMVLVAHLDPGDKGILSSNNDDAFHEFSQAPIDVATTDTTSEMFKASLDEEGSNFSLPTEIIQATIDESTEIIEPIESEILPEVADVCLHPETEEVEEAFLPETPLTEPVARAFVHLESQEEPTTNPNAEDSSLQQNLEVFTENALEEKKEMDPEEEKLAQQIQLNPRSAETWEALGALYKAASRYENAIMAYKQAISIKPDVVSFHHNLGLVYSAQGNNKDAFIAFQTVLELDPNHSLTHASLGGYYKKMGLEELAQKHIGKAMKKIYESENEYNRACLGAICGNNEEAIELLRVALENQQTNVDWVLHDPDLEPLREDNRFKQLIAEYSV